VVRGQIDSALIVSRRAWETDSTNITTLLSGTWANLAANHLQEAHALAIRLPEPTEGRGYHLAKSGDIEGARQVLRRLDSKTHEWGDETQRALTYLGLGDTASGLSALKRATDAGEIWALQVPVLLAPFDSVRGSATFHALLKRVGLGEHIPTLTR
jgi:hypothetical protein